MTIQRQNGWRESERFAQRVYREMAKVQTNLSPRIIKTHNVASD